MEIPFELTHKCNCRCEMCRFWVEGSTIALQEMDHDQVIKIIENIKKYYDENGKRLFFGLTGGEPFLKNNFLKIIEHLHRNSIGYDMVTNFSVPNEQILDQFAVYPPERINISLDGIGETHNLVRGRNIFDDIVRNIKYFKRISPQTPIKINSTINKRNIESLTEITKFAIDNGLELNFQHLNFISPELLDEQRRLEIEELNGATVHEATFYTLNEEEVVKLQKEVNRVKKMAKNKNFGVTFLPDLDKNLATWYLKPEQIIAENRCDINRLRIKPDGRVVHCENFVYGNLVNDDFADVINSSDAKRFRTMIEKGNMPFCRRCCLRFKGYKE